MVSDFNRANPEALVKHKPSVDWQMLPPDPGVSLVQVVVGFFEDGFVTTRYVVKNDSDVVSLSACKREEIF